MLMHAYNNLNYLKFKLTMTRIEILNLFKLEWKCASCTTI